MCIFTVLVAATLAVAIGRAPTATKWGAKGVESMYAAGIICTVSSVLAMVPLSVAAGWFRKQIGEAALAATVLRLLLTVFMAAAYQTWEKPDLGPFLFWASVFYGLSLIIDTTFALLIVRRVAEPKGAVGANA
ncbi:MAG: hypothetical protein AABZ47_15965 [Planctomycetota bacterium]